MCNILLCVKVDLGIKQKHFSGTGIGVKVSHVCAMCEQFYTTTLYYIIAIDLFLLCMHFTISVLNVLFVCRILLLFTFHHSQQVKYILHHYTKITRIQLVLVSNHSVNVCLPRDELASYPEQIPYDQCSQDPLQNPAWTRTLTEKKRTVYIYKCGFCYMVCSITIQV